MTGDADDHQPRDHPLSGLESLSQWVKMCVDLSSADGAAVVASTERHDDRHRILYATDPTAERVADLLFVLGYGPHTTATPAHPAQTVTTTDPDDRRTWPLLIDELVAVGVHWRQVHAIGSPGSALGTLQLYRRRRPPARSLDADTTVSALARALGSEPGPRCIIGAGLRAPTSSASRSAFSLPGTVFRCRRRRRCSEPAPMRANIRRWTRRNALSSLSATMNRDSREHRAVVNGTSGITTRESEARR